MNYQQKIIACIKSDQTRLRALRAVQTLGLPDCLIAAGFVRNAIWDLLYHTQTPMSDIDVIYFCRSDCSANRDQSLEEELTSLEPSFPWSVKNQARMHTKNGDRSYHDTLDAMSYWPEKQTSIGVKLDDQNNVVIHHCFDISLQFNGKISHNPLTEISIFEKRVKDKAWQIIWPELKIEIA